MTVQDDFGRIGAFEDFIRPIEDSDTTIVDADGLMYNDTLIIAISGDVAANATVDEPNGVIQFSGAGGAGDGIVMIQSPMRPDRNAPMVVGGRCKSANTTTDFRFFGGFASTVDRDESVIPFSLSGTTLTANNTGETVGFYFDTAATTDDFRFMSSTAGAADTTAAVTPGSKVLALNSNATTLGSLGIRAGAVPVADKYWVWRVEIDPDGTARGYLGDESMGVSGLTLIATLKAGPLSTTTMYFPFTAMIDVSTGDVLHEVDYFYSKGNRYWGA